MISPHPFQTPFQSNYIVIILGSKMVARPGEAGTSDFQAGSLAGHLLVTWVFWNFRFSDFRLSRFFSGNIFLKNMLVRYRGINNKGVLERPWTIWRVLEAISTTSTLKCQFTGKCRKVDFLTPCTTKSAETLQVAPYGRCGPPGNP